jgi:3-oxoacyl-[acyl-carrier-protein] synthase III
VVSSRIDQVRITGIAASVPTLEIDNVAWSNFALEETQKIISSTGVKKRRIAEQLCTSDLCFDAAKTLLEKVVCDPASIDVIIFVSQTPDYVLPATACVLQHRLGLHSQVMAFDINLGCSGYTYGLSVLAQLLSAGHFKKGLLLAGDTVSKMVSEQDRSVAFLFGDAGSATLLEFDVTAPPMYFDCGTNGAGFDKLMVAAGGFRHRATSETQQRKLCEAGNIRAQTELLMSGADVFSFTLKEVPKTITQTLQAANWSQDDVDYFLFHQANAFMLNHIIKKMHIAAPKALMSLSTYGNTSVASIPVTLCHEFAKFPMDTSKKLLLSGFGVGFSWATLACEVTNMMVLPIIFCE